MPDRRFPSADNGRRDWAANPPPKEWGVGRVAFFTRIDTIRAELAQGWPLTAIYARHKKALGIGYWGFYRLVVRHAADARPVPLQAVNDEPKRKRHASARAASLDTPTTATKPPPIPSVEGSDAHAAHQRHRTFNHDPIERPGDYERLFGVRNR
jgi:hypothetical protein